MTAPAPAAPARIALFGGTFDPPHRGHLAVARAAADRFALSTVLFTPVGRQPLKPEGSSSPYAARLEMVRLACAATADPRFTVSGLDAPHPDGTPNYTVDTLAALADAHPGATLFKLLGADSFHHIGHWREPGRLLALAEWIVISRPGFPLASPEALSLTPAQRARIHLLGEVHEEVSATALRAGLRAGQDCQDLLPPAVAAYIHQHRLYGA